MHSAVKVLIGLVMIMVGLGFFIDDVVPIFGTVGTFGIHWLTNFVIVLTGVIPIFLIMVGLFIVWLEIDELKSQKELRKEEKREHREEKKEEKEEKK